MSTFLKGLALAVILMITNIGPVAAQSGSAEGLSQPIWQIFEPNTDKSVKWVKYSANPRFAIYDLGTPDLTDDIVWDRETGLVWQRSPQNFAFTFQQTSNFCNRVKIGGRYGWRTFTIEEGGTLLDDSTDDNLPAGHPFLNLSAFYWSSTTNPDDAAGTSARGLNLDIGALTVNGKGALGRAWCVRGGVGHDTKYAF